MVENTYLESREVVKRSLPISETARRSIVICCALLLFSCEKQSNSNEDMIMEENNSLSKPAIEAEYEADAPLPEGVNLSDDLRKVDVEPLVKHIFTADPSAHVFEGKIYIYPSHDWETEIPADNEGSHFDMRDYHVFSMDKVGGPVKDHGVALALEDIPWASRQLWAPDAAHRNGKYYLYFPAKDAQDIFRIGVAVSDNPAGPFKAEPTPIEGSYSIDPSVFEDRDGEYYLYVGGIWGGQLQRWVEGVYVGEDRNPAANEPALAPLVAKLNTDMISLAEELKPIAIVDEKGAPILNGDNDRRFFEAAWVHRYKGRYYFSYSTGDTHKIAYAVGDSPYGPFTYKGTVLNPVLGWTNHHSIAKFEGRWYLFFHDSSLSKGETHLRSIKMVEIFHRPDGSIQTVDALTDVADEEIIE